MNIPTPIAPSIQSLAVATESTIFSTERALSEQGMTLYFTLGASW